MFWSISIALVIAAYVWLVARCCISFSRGDDTVTSPPECRADVIVAGRNEQDNVDALMHCMASQTMGGARLIFVDDHSTDSTYQKVSSSPYPAMVLHSPGHGKKDALRHGIANSTAPCILSTDADCLPAPQWACLMTSTCMHHSADMVMAPVIIEPVDQESLFQRLQHAESLAMITITGGSCMGGHPVMCNGGNIGYRSRFLKASLGDINDRYASGDDMFMMESANRQHRRIVYAKNGGALVTTACSTTMRQLFNQRARWVSKTGGYTDSYIIFFALAIFLGNMAAGILPLMLIFKMLPLWFGVLVLMAKALADAWSAMAPARFYNQKTRWTDILILELAYPYYVLATVVKSMVGGFRWK